MDCINTVHWNYLSRGLINLESFTKRTVLSTQRLTFHSQFSNAMGIAFRCTGIFSSDKMHTILIFFLLSHSAVRILTFKFSEWPIGHSIIQRFSVIILVSTTTTRPIQNEEIIINSNEIEQEMKAFEEAKVGQWRAAAEVMLVVSKLKMVKKAEKLQGENT